jgi:hypothetical protein
MGQSRNDTRTTVSEIELHKVAPSQGGLHSGRRASRVERKAGESWVDVEGGTSSKESILPHKGTGILRTTEFVFRD